MGKDGNIRHADAKYDLKPADDHDALIAAVRALGKAEEKKGEEKKAEEKKAEEKKSAAERRPFPRLEGLAFGKVMVDGKPYTKDVVIDRGVARERDKGPSKDEQPRYGHTPLTARESIPWHSATLVIGTGIDGKLPVPDELKEEARRRGVTLVILKTAEAIEYIARHAEEDLSAVLHITC